MPNLKNDPLACQGAAIKIKQWQENPFLFIEEQLPHIKLWSGMRAMIDSVWKNKRTTFRACHGISKTISAAIVAVTFLNVFRNSIVITSAPCYDDQTEILTEDGWKLFKDLQNEKVASLEDDQLKYVDPLEYHDYPYNGEMIGYDGQYLDFLVTPNHRCYVARLRNKNQNCSKWGIRRASDIYGMWDIYFNKKCSWKGIDDRYTEKHYELWGFWFADGYARYDKKDRRCDVTLTQSKYIDYAEELLRIYNLPISKQKRKIAPPHLLHGKYIETKRQSYNLTIYNKKIAMFFVDNFYKDKKKIIPAWLKNAPPNKLKSFIHGFIMGDGTYAKNNYSTTRLRIYNNIQLGNQVQEIGIKAGYIVNLHNRIRRDSLVSDLTFLTTHNIQKEYPKTQRKHWYKKEYNGHVYCVKVPSGIVLIRRNGIYHWSGNTGRQVRDLLWKEIGALYERNQSLVGEYHTLRIEESPEWYAMGFSTDYATRIEGYHAPYILWILDEAKGLPQWLYDSIEGSLTGGFARVLETSTTDGADQQCPFRRHHTVERRNWNVIHLSAYDSPFVHPGKYEDKDKLKNKLLYKYGKPKNRREFSLELSKQIQIATEEWIDDRVIDWQDESPDLVETKVYGEFATKGTDNAIPLAWVESAVNAEVQETNYLHYGFDVARMGDDSDVLFKRRGPKVYPAIVWGKKDTMESSGLVIQAINKDGILPFEKVVRGEIQIDIDGLGSGVFDRLAELGYPVRGIHSNAKPIYDDRKYFNLRSEMWFNARDMFKRQYDEGGILSIPNDPILIEELTGIKYKPHSDGTLRVEKKEDFKKRLGRSPDRGDALVYCLFHFPTYFQDDQYFSSDQTIETEVMI